MIEVEGIVLSCLEYREKDALVYFASTHGLQTIYARGIQSSTSKNKRLCNPFSKVKLTLDHKEGRQMDVLIRGELLAYYYEIQEDLVAQSVCFVLRDCLSRVQMDATLYQYLLSCWMAFQSKSDEAYVYACLCLAYALKIEGIAPFVQGCIRCHSKKQLETVSLKDGGFLCKACNHQYLAWPLQELKKFRGLFIVQPEVVEAFCSIYTYSLLDFLFLAKWYEHYEHLELASIQFLRSISKLNA